MKRLGDFLNAITRLEPRLVVGLMSGTSADGIDAALCRIHGHGGAGRKSKGARVELVHFESLPYSSGVTEKLKCALSLKADELSLLNVKIGEEFSLAANLCIEKSGRTNDSVSIIGSHGQTIYHHSGRLDIPKSTLQIGDGDIISERTGILTISDFRMRDIASGGEGAPLTPYADPVFFGQEAKVILNLGGIANISIIDTKGNVTGFDTGPANAPLDRLAKIITNGAEKFDRNGSIARTGSINQDLLKSLLSKDPFIMRPPPKSTGLESYGDEFVTELIRNFGTPSPDFLATMCEFAAKSISKGLEISSVSQSLVVVAAGGGSQNAFLMERIRENISPRELKVSDEFGVPWYAREAMAFALFANDALFSHQTSLPKVTGASKGVTLGKLSFP